jgi:hypothetical protein
MTLGGTSADRNARIRAMQLTIHSNDKSAVEVIASAIAYTNKQ